MKTRLVKPISNSAILIVAILVGGIIVEIVLRVDGRYDDPTPDNLIPSVAIWDRPPGAMVRDMMTGDPSEQTRQWAAHFRRLLET